MDEVVVELVDDVLVLLYFCLVHFQLNVNAVDLLVFVLDIRILTSMKFAKSIMFVVPTVFTSFPFLGTSFLVV
jgi:hypothetical protein